MVVFIYNHPKNRDFRGVSLVHPKKKRPIFPDIWATNGSPFRKYFSESFPVFKKAFPLVTYSRINDQPCAWTGIIASVDDPVKEKC